jgi:hypothetical protein
MVCWLFLVSVLGGGFPCGADVNGDGEVGPADLALLTGGWGFAQGQTGFLANLDLDQDGRIAVLDLVWALNAQGSTCGPQLGGCPIFPPDHIWNTRVDALPLHGQSSVWIATIGANTAFHMDFGSGTWAGGPIGIPFVLVAGSQPLVPISFTVPEESNPGPYPIPADAPIEGGPQANGDRHVLVLETGSCTLYELYSSWPQNGGQSWQAYSGARFELNSYALRPDGWTSADAAGLPILPGLVRYEEILEGRIAHALRFTAPVTQGAYVWPARHFASSSTNPAHPPLGIRVRLKANYDISGFSSTNQIILTALKEYGMMLADNGSAWYISGAPDERWDNGDLHELDVLRGSNFEVVDVSGLMIHPDSGQALPP